MDFLPVEPPAAASPESAGSASSKVESNSSSKPLPEIPKFISMPKGMTEFTRDMFIFLIFSAGPVVQ
jgi:hypothetical protein